MTIGFSSMEVIVGPKTDKNYFSVLVASKKVWDKTNNILKCEHLNWSCIKWKMSTLEGDRGFLEQDPWVEKRLWNLENMWRNWIWTELQKCFSLERWQRQKYELRGFVKRNVLIVFIFLWNSRHAIGWELEERRDVLGLKRLEIWGDVE